MPTPTLVKFSDSVRAIRIDSIGHDSVGDIKAAAVTTSASRLTSIKASAASTNSKTREAYIYAKRGCERLGFSLDAVAEAGGVRELDKAMTEQRWDNTDRMALKSALAAVGAIS
jgi:hypothetical protein